MSDEKPAKKHVPTSELLQQFVDENRTGEVAFKDFVARLGDRGFGLIVLILALPNAVPIGIPGISSICAVPIMFFSLQMVFGRHQLWLPKFIGEKRFSEEKFDSILKKCIPFVRWIEKFVHPRFAHLTVGVSEKFAGIMLFVLAAVIFLPIPGGNFLPSVCMVVISLGMLHRDGVMVLGGSLAGVGVTWGMWFVIDAFFRAVYKWIDGWL